MYQALALMSLPSNVPPSLAELHALSCDILTLANDSSVDASWYTKRLSVAAIYASAEVVMTEDTSPGFTATKDFVERRIKDSHAIREAIADIKQFARFMASGMVGLGRNRGMKI
jgi:ubiquinone biosynthesis protein COQ9